MVEHWLRFQAENSGLGVSNRAVDGRFGAIVCKCRTNKAKNMVVLGLSGLHFRAENAVNYR